ncbi:MAG: hypothetical protein ABI282_05605 [Candidatus Baltobacteraceae bacterium]
MTYVEWLRVRNVLRVVAIILGLSIVVSLVLRISFNGYLKDDSTFLSHIQTQVGTRVTHAVLPNGIPQTIIDDPVDKTHVTIDNLGYGGRHIVITEPKTHSHSHDHVTIGSVQVTESQKGDTFTTVIDTNSAVPFLYYMILANLAALIVATILGSPLARENDGHLEFAFTRPASRTELALRAMGVDIVGIVAASVMAVIALIVCQAMFEVPHFDFSGINVQAVLIGIALPLAWFAMLTAATTWMKRGYGAIVGFAWPVAILVLVFGTISWGNSLVGEAVHNIFWVIARLNPLTYVSFSTHPETLGNSPASVAAPDFGPRLAMELILLLIYVALALYQWRRVEA